MVPTKRILSKAHLAAFERSPAHADILAFIDGLNESIVGKKLSDKGEGSEVSVEWRYLSVYLCGGAEALVHIADCPGDTRRPCCP